jgi:hypothetical protein
MCSWVVNSKRLEGTGQIMYCTVPRQDCIVCTSRVDQTHDGILQQQTAITLFNIELFGILFILVIIIIMIIVLL